MKVMVKDIPSAGMEFVREVPASSLGLTDEDLKCLSSLQVSVRLEKIQNAVVASVEVKGRYQFLCTRCLEEIEHDNCERFKLEYMVDPAMTAIDLGEDIRQEMIIDLPLRVLCKEDCRGLCASCGANLNKESCRCKN